MSSVSKRAHQTAALLDVDPDLGNGLEPDEEEAARRRAVAGVIELQGPQWDPSSVSASADAGWLGLFVVDGLMLRRVTVSKRAACELFGPGDLVRPWDSDGEYEPLPISVNWLVLRPTRLALLDTGFALRIARWPSIAARLLSKVSARARYLALTQAVTHLPRTHPRLLLLFWLLAERWGTMGPNGVHITLPLTHEVLAMLVGSQRPTVTIGLQRLAQAGLLTRESSDRWLLTTRAMEYLSHPDSLAMIGEATELNKA